MKFLLFFSILVVLGSCGQPMESNNVNLDNKVSFQDDISNLVQKIAEGKKSVERILDNNDSQTSTRLTSLADTSIVLDLLSGIAALKDNYEIQSDKNVSLWKAKDDNEFLKEIEIHKTNNEIDYFKVTKNKSNSFGNLKEIIILDKNTNQMFYSKEEKLPLKEQSVRKVNLLFH